MSFFSRKKAAEGAASDSLVNTDHGAYSKLGWWIVLAGVGGFLLWAFTAPLDKGVPVSGTVVVSGARKAVQHQYGGTIQDILVKEGDQVKQGQVLVRMIDVTARAQAEVTRVQYFTARVVEARLVAERDGKKALVFSPELEKAKSDPRVEASMQMQKQLFTSRQSALQSELAAMEQGISGLKNQISGLEQSRNSKQSQLKLLKEQLSGLRDLAADGFVARNRVLELERTMEQLHGAIAEDIGNIGRARSQMAELSMRSAQRLQEYQKEVRSHLSEVQREAETQQARLTSNDFDLAATEVRAPAAGTVVGLSVFTKGGVVPPGFKMMDIVPSDVKLVVEGQVPVHLIDKVHAGLDVEMMFTAFNQNTTPHIPGKLVQVSADRFVDEHNGMPYYKMKAEVTADGMKKLAHLKVQPGMPVDLFVKTGERTMMSYLLKPIIDRAQTSMAEE
ncbi:HlyD family type I secretion periplasmic adaptor subunit [Massilia sp. W12]|uniref:HlyD family type I secretion periplasmic adaptor subunit n=1 Tax=Massilia sp. W12 TaxID=3126507 RepID=UPI0030CD0ADB